MTETIDAPPAALDLAAPPQAPNPANLVPPTPVHAATPMPPPPPASSVLAPPELPALTAAPTPSAPTTPPSTVPAPAPAAPAPATPAMTTGPSAIFAADAAAIPFEPAVPLLPKNTPVMQSAPVAKATASAFDIDDLVGATSANRKAPPKPKGRWLVRLMLVGLLGAGGWAGQEYGPELYDEYVEKNEDSGPAEAAAPLAFPNVPVTAAPIRTAEFVLVGLPETPGATYRVTTDFETDVSQVDITRDSGPNLQILTYGNDAMIRRADGAQWYLLERGQFPLDGRLERSDWVRRLDELLPAAVRNQVTIDDSTESTTSGVPTRRLAITVDAALLDAASPPEAPAVEDAVAEAPVDPGTDVAVPIDESIPPTVVDPAAPDATPVPTTGAIQIEIWVDGDGLVRQVSGAPQLGADTITVVRTSAEAWIPAYPEPGEIATLTASALVDLGL